MYNTFKNNDDKILKIRQVKQLVTPGKKTQHSWLRKVLRRIKIDQQVLRQTLEVTFWR